MNQESVDLNAYIANECKYLKNSRMCLASRLTLPTILRR